MTKPKSVSGPGAQQSSILPELSSTALGVPGWSHFLPLDHTELNEKWHGQQRIRTVQAMLNHWQVASVRQAIRLPTATYVIELDPGQIDPVSASLLAIDLDTPLVGAPNEQRPGLSADRFSARRHFDRALDALDYGHAVFEQAGRYDDAGYWRLTDLAPVPQWTIADLNSWEVDDKGRLLNVVQWMHNPPLTLPVDHLVTFTWQGAPGDPRGRSMLRPLYGPWLLSDRLVRVMGMSGERTGMGIPVGRVGMGAAGGAKEKMEALLAGLAAGNDTNLVLETDDDIRQQVMLMGVTGSTPDIVGMLRFLDDVMARAMLAMLLNLSQGSGTGSFALGGTFDDLLSDFHDTVVDWYCDVMTEQLIEPWLIRNRGREELADIVCPRLVWKRRESTAPAAAPAPAAAADPNTVDGTATEDPAQPQLPAPTAAARHLRQSDLARRQRATRTAFASVTGRDLRRDPTSVELAAATDFATIESQFVATQQNIATALVAVRDELTGVAVEQVAAMQDVDPLTLGDTLAPSLEQHAQEMDSAPLVALLVAFAAAGVHQVVGEAARQGVTLTATVDYEERAAADAADLMRRMARQVADSAATAARTGVAPGVGGQPAANVVADHLAGLSSAGPEQAAAGASSRAQNAGRAAAIDAGPVASIAASELLDQNTCAHCLLNDGHEYGSLDSALAEYPGGGFVRCDGMERCRGLLVAVFDASQEAAA